MVEEKKIPRGYKKTEVGVIPEEWLIWRLGDVADIKTGKKNNEDKVSDGNYPFFVRSAQIERINTFSYEGEAVLVPGEGRIGSIFHYIDGRFDYHQRVYKISDFGKIKGKYVYYFLMSNFNKHAIQHSVKATVDSLRLPTFQDFVIYSPESRREQQAIAEVLSDADDLINSIENLIEKKQKIKQGAMQELLTGKRRLPGFSGAWETRRIAELGDFGSGDGFPIKYQKIKHGEYPFFKVSDMSNQNNEIYMNTASNYISEDVKNKIGSTVFPKGTIVFAKIGAAIFLERKRILVHPSCIDNNMMGFIVNEEICNINFIHMVLTNMKFGKMTRTSALPSLNSSDIGQVELLIPKTLHEQQAIAQILSDMDYEIETLEEKLKKYRALKQGMMQELLTGRIRLL